MSVDTVNYALTCVRARIQRYPDHYSEEGRNLLIAMCDVMRMHLMQEDIAQFDQYVDHILGRDPDAASFILEELFEELGFGPDGIREQLSAELVAA